MAASQRENALKDLRDRILRGALPPGARLVEVDLAETLGISRTPLRDILGQLDREGLLARGPRGGYRVRSYTVDDVIDAIELRGVIEGTVARRSAERGATPQDLDRMARAIDQLDAVLAPGPAEMDFDAYAQGNSAFHSALHGMAGSAVMSEHLTHTLRQPFASPDVFVPAQASLPAFRASLIVAQEQHRALWQAIQGREGSRAEHIAREHARHARTNLEHLMTHDPALMPLVPGLGLVTPPTDVAKGP